VRLVHDPAAPAVPHWNPDDTHSYRQKELLAALNARLAEMAANKVNSFDVQCLRRVHGIDANPTFYHRPLHGSPQYSLAFMEWMLEESWISRHLIPSARPSAVSTFKESQSAMASRCRRRKTGTILSTMWTASRVLSSWTAIDRSGSQLEPLAGGDVGRDAAHRILLGCRRRSPRLGRLPPRADAPATATVSLRQPRRP